MAALCLSDLERQHLTMGKICCGYLIVHYRIVSYCGIVPEGNTNKTLVKRLQETFDCSTHVEVKPTIICRRAPFCPLVSEKGKVL